jgi:hypothetical protein
MLALLAWCAPCGARAQEGQAALEEPPRATKPHEQDADQADEAVVDAAQAQAELARYAHEPKVETVVDAAIAALPAPRAAALASRARDAGWVPKLGLRARRGQGVDWSQTLGDQSIDVKSDDDLTLEASLSFELDRVVFRSEEVALARQTQLEGEQRRARVREVIALYFERRRLQLERDRHGDPELARSVRIAEIEAVLDVFTKQAFRRMMAAAAWTTDVSTPATPSRSRPKSKPTER